MAVFRTFSLRGVRGGALAALPRDDRAQVSFSVVAVAILLAAAASGVYFAKKEMDKTEEMVRLKLLAELESSIEEVRLELSLCAVSNAHRVVSEWREYPVNETKISSEYSSIVSDYIRSSFPRLESGVSLSLTNWSGALFLVEMQTLDIVPSENTESSRLDLDGTFMDYEDLPAPTTDEVAVTTANPYYVALGSFSILAWSEGVSLSKDLSFDRPVISALPFLESKLRAFEAASEGEFSDMGRMVGYMLTTLAQLRALEGYGLPLYTGLDTPAILTEQDVYRASAVALLIEQARLFRSFDQSFADEVVGACGGNTLGIVALEGSGGRCLDPAELFMWFLGLTEPHLDPGLLAAEAIAGLADQLVVGLMEYMGWMGLMDLADAAVSTMSNTLDSLVEYLTGEDKALKSVVTWISRTLDLTGQSQSSQTTAFASEPDFTVSVPERAYFVENAAGELYPVWVGGIQATVDVPAYDLMQSSSWAEFYPRFKEHQSSLSGLVYDSVARLAFDVSSVCSVDLSGMAFDPTDDKDLFTAMAERVGSVDVSVSPEALLDAAAGLPMFSAQHALSGEFADFVSSHSEVIIPEYLADAMYDNLADSVIAAVRHSYIPDLAVPVEQQLEEIVRTDLEHSIDWGVRDEASWAFDTYCGFALSRLVNAVNMSVVRADDRYAGPLVDSVAVALLVGSGSFPGIEDAVEGTLTRFAEATLAQKRMSSYKQSVYLDLGGEFGFWEGDLASAEGSGAVLSTTLSVEVPGGLPGLAVVPFDPASTTFDNLFPADELLVQVKRPWDHDRSEGAYPNVHLVPIAKVSATPYSTQWQVSVKGVIDVRTVSSDAYLSSAMDQDASSERPLLISFSLPVMVQSPWPLEGVEYNPSNTLISDMVDAAAKFCEYLWDKLEPVISWVKDGLEAVFHFVQGACEAMAAFSAKIVKAIARCVQVMVETLQTYVQKFADSALARATRLFVDLVGNVEFAVSMHGFTLIVRTNLPDLLYKKSCDLVRVIVCTDRFGPGFAFGVRVAKLADGRHDIIVNGTVTLKSGTVEVVVDPLMVVLRKLVEVHCRMDTWALDMAMPEAEPYETVEATTASLPGVGAFLSNIPIPVLGVKASVEAGLRLKYSPPFPTDVVVNEFEANPEGDDSGREWVELYNPLSEPRCVDGWSICTAHGGTVEMPIQGTISPGSFMVFVFPETSIDNGQPGDPFNDGDSLVLLDSQGKMVDFTPTLCDAYNDLRTHQRSWDGGPKWVLREGTRGDSNGPALLIATSDFIAKSLFQAFKQAFDDTSLSEVGASLDFVALLAKRVLHHFIENLLSLVGEIIHEVVLFVKVMFGDAAGVAGTGVRASFVVTGESIVELLRWLVHSLATFIVNIGRPTSPVAYPAFPQAFFSGMYIRFDALFEVGAPKILSSMGVSDGLPDRLTCVVTIGPNIPFLGKLAGKPWGQWRVDFGVYLEGVPRECVSSFTVKGAGDLVDLWLLKGCVYGA